MATQKELAEIAGVSAGTVSNVVSGSTRVSDHTRKKVLEAIRKLDYRPNLIARSLKTNRTNTLAIVIPEITNPFFPKLVCGAGLAAREHGRFLIVVDTDEDAALELELISILQSQRVDGILLVSATGDWNVGDNLALLQSGPPILCLDRVPRGLNVDSVSVDNRAAAAMGVAHLLSMGHRRIAVITGPLNLTHENERLSGYRQALQRAGIKTQDSLIWASTFDPRAIEEACHKGLLLGAIDHLRCSAPTDSWPWRRSAAFTRQVCGHLKTSLSQRSMKSPPLISFNRQLPQSSSQSLRWAIELLKLCWSESRRAMH